MVRGVAPPVEAVQPVEVVAPRAVLLCVGIGEIHVHVPSEPKHIAGADVIFIMSAGPRPVAVAEVARGVGRGGIVEEVVVEGLVVRAVVGEGGRERQVVVHAGDGLEAERVGHADAPRVAVRARGLALAVNGYLVQALAAARQEEAVEYARGEAVVGVAAERPGAQQAVAAAVIVVEGGAQLVVGAATGLQLEVVVRPERGAAGRGLAVGVAVIVASGQEARRHAAGALVGVVVGEVGVARQLQAAPRVVVAVLGARRLGGL